MAGRFKAASLCRSCEKSAADRRGGARCAVWLRLLGTAVKGCPRSGFSASRVGSQCVPVAQGCWQEWKRSYDSTDEVPREKKKTAPCWTCPPLRPLLPPGWHGPRGRLHVYTVSQEDRQTQSHETVRAGARSLSFGPSSLRRRAGARVKTFSPSVTNRFSWRH